MTKKYRIYISGKTSSRNTNYILHNMLPSLGYSAENGTGSDQIPAIHNLHRGNEETYFDVDIHNNDDNALSIIEAMKRYILENSIVSHEDITTEPPKNYKIDG